MHELHIVGLIVHAMPACIDQVGTAITSLPDAQVHGSDASGKMVITLEAATSADILDQISVVRNTHGVLNVAMVYQHAESLESLNAEIHHADHPT